MLDRVWQDLRQSFRLATRQWGFTLAAVVTIALGAGANATVFSLVNAVLLRPMPIGEPERAVNIHGTAGPGDRFNPFSYPEYQDLAERSRALTEIAAHTEVNAVLKSADATQLITGQLTSANYFEAMALMPVAGRFFAAAEEKVGAVPVVVLSHALWQQKFAGDRAIVGQAVTLNGHAFTVIGIAPPEFRGPYRGVDYVFWVPIGTRPLLVRPSSGDAGDLFTSRRSYWLQLVGRLAPTATLASAQSELTGIRKSLAQEFGSRDDDPGVELFQLTGLPDFRRGPIVAFMGVLIAVSALVLLTACVNLAGMLVGRGLVRSREIALRVALGASRKDLIRQLLLETAVLLSAGAIAGLLIATWTTDLLLAFLPTTDVPLVLDLSMDLRVVGYTFGSVIFAGALLGLLPIIQISRPELVETLKTGSSSIVGGRMRLRRFLVRVQVATAFVLVVVAGLFARSLARAADVDPGFEPEGVIAAMVDVGPNALSMEQGLTVHREIERQLRARPDVEHVSFAMLLPLGQGIRGGAAIIPGVRNETGGPNISVRANTVSANYLKTMGIPLLRGREFSEQDRRDSQPVIVINETMAKRYWPNSDAIGATIESDGRMATIIGIAADSKMRSLSESPAPTVYTPMSQSFEPASYVQVRTRNADAVMRALPDIARSAEASAAVYGAARLERHIGFALVPQKVATALAMSFSALGILLSGLGLYAVVAFWTTQRRRELAIRSALGASPRDVIRLVTREGLRLIGTGALAGLLVAVASTRLLRSFLFGVSPLDPITLLGALAVTGVLLIAACAQPARRALRLQPMQVLRE
jgi:predicted permease